MELRYGPVHALAGVDFDLLAGEVHALLGENGAGKSSLMQVLVGARRPDAGTMQLAGSVYRPASTAAALDAGVAMVFQELTVLPHLTVAENLWLGRECTRRGLVDRRARCDDAERVLARLGREDLSPDCRVAELPPAARQMLEIARALLADAKVLVLDEPTSSLGVADVEHLFTVVDQLRTEGLGVIYISHALEEVRALCDRCTVMRDGRRVATGTLAELDDRELVRHMAGRPLDEVFPPRRDPSARGPIRFAAREVRAEPLAAPVSFELAGGEIAGIAGLAGAGRTELMQALFGTRRRQSGSIAVDDREFVATPHACWDRGVGALVEDRKHEGLAIELPIATNIVLPHLGPHRGKGAAGALLDSRSIRAAATATGERVNLRCHSVTQNAGELSGGNQQKVAIARLLHAGCNVLLLDEPTRGIDVGSRQEIYTLLDRAARDGAAILVVSSHLPELLGLCDRIAVMCQGRLGEFRAASDWTQEALLAAAMPGPAATAGLSS